MICAWVREVGREIVESGLVLDEIQVPVACKIRLDRMGDVRVVPETPNVHNVMPLLFAFGWRAQNAAERRVIKR